jgi:hypothetical protein
VERSASSISRTYGQRKSLPGFRVRRSSGEDLSGSLNAYRARLESVTIGSRVTRRAGFPAATWCQRALAEVGANADEVIGILSQTTPFKDPARYKSITPTGMNPDGKGNVDSLAADLAFYKEQGLLEVDARSSRSSTTRS